MSRFLKNKIRLYQGFQGLRYRGVIYLYYFPFKNVLISQIK